MPHPLSHKYPIPTSQLCLVNTDVPAGIGAPPLDTTRTRNCHMTVRNYEQRFPVFCIYSKIVFGTFLKRITLQPICVFVIVFTVAT